MSAASTIRMSEPYPKVGTSALGCIGHEHAKEGEVGRHALRPWPKYLTARVAADYCDTSPWTIRRNVRPCGRRGRSYIYSIEDVERWMRGQPVGQTSAASTTRLHERAGRSAA